MKRFLTLTGLFFLPLAGFIACIFTVDLPREYAYRYTRNEGCNISWIHDRLYRHGGNIDIAFIGSSHTGCGVDDGLIDSLLPGVSCVNLAYCEGGRNIHYAVLKDLLKRHRIKTLVLEVRLDEDLVSHRDFGMIGDLVDVARAPLAGNTHYLTDLFKAFQVRYMYFQDRLLNVLPDTSNRLPFNSHSFRGVFDGEAEQDVLLRHAQRESEKVNAHTNGAWWRFRMNYPRYYLEKINELSEQYGFDLVFLYIPSYGMASDVPFNIDFYRARGEIILPEKELFTRPENWMDTEHFNNAGAEKFSIWLAEILARQ